MKEIMDALNSNGLSERPLFLRTSNGE